MRVLEEHAQDIKGADEFKEEEDLVEVTDKSFDIIAKHHDTMRECMS